MTATSAIDKSTQILFDQELEFPVKKKLRHSSSVEQVLLDQTAGPPLFNGYKSRVDHDTSMNDQPESQTVKTQVSASAEPVSPSAESPGSEGSVSTTDIDGVPVVQEIAPGEAMRVPPILEKHMEEQTEDVDMNDTESLESTDAIIKPISPSATESEPEIPESPGTPDSASSLPPAISPLLEEVRRPHTPLVVITNQKNRPPSLLFAPPSNSAELHADVSSPTSSIDGAETPNNGGLSSATSPDAGHMTLEHPRDGKHGTREVVGEIGMDHMGEEEGEGEGEEDEEDEEDGDDDDDDEQQEEQEEVEEQVEEDELEDEEEEGEANEELTQDDEGEEGVIVEEQPVDLPSVSLVGNIMETEVDVGVSIRSSVVGHGAQETKAFPEVLASPVVKYAKSPVTPPQAAAPTTPVSKLPFQSQFPSAADRILQLGQPTPNSSPDPSAQLRLEHQLANGAPVPASGILVVNGPVPVPAKSLEEEQESAATHHHEEEEEEDEVQLVGSREPELSIRQKMLMETPAQTPATPKEVTTEAKEIVVPEITDKLFVHVPLPEPAVVLKEAPQTATEEPETEEVEEVVEVEEDEEEDGSEVEEEEDGDEEDQNEDGDEDEDEEDGDGDGEEERVEDVVMGEAQQNEPESISVPYQRSPAPEAEEEDGPEDEVVERERIYGEDERMDVTPGKMLRKSLDPTIQPILPAKEGLVPESVVETKTVPIVDATPVVVDTTKRGVGTITDTFHNTKPPTAVNFNLPTPDATNAQFSAPASTAAISPLRQRTSKTLRRQREREKSRSKLRKVVISSAHHAAAAAEAEAQRLREDQENQGMIVVARRRDQQAASAAARGRSAPFPPGSKADVITRYEIIDTPPVDVNAGKKNLEAFDVLYTVKSSQHTAKDLISRASKTVSTSNHQVHYFESQAARILSKIQKMQDEGLSSLRQIERAREPRRRKCHWDYLLEEAMWLREDFREERRWKIAVAKQVVEWVVEWHEADEDRRELCVDRRRWGRVPKWIREERKVVGGGDVDMTGSGGFGREFHQLTPELVAGGATPEDEGSDCYFQGREGHGSWGTGRDFFGYIQDPPPAAIFTLGPEETVFGVAPTKAAEDMLGQLPLFAPPKPPNVESRRFEVVQEEWMTPITSVTKYCTGKLSLEHEEEGPPRKKSRYEYVENYELFADDSDDDDFLSGAAYTGRYSKRERDRTRKPVPLPPEQTNVALFSPHSKSLLQRLHNAHMFRSPSDLPPAAFFESRTPSLWTTSEDEMLKQLAREYHHNWSLVATCLTLEGTWHSGSERRSPWECFERWIGLEPVTPEFMKSPYYKPVQQRLDIAARVGGMYVSTNPNSAGGSTQQGPMTKRRGTVPVKVEKRRVTKFFNIFDAMRKLAKKRETSISKQQSGRGMLCVLIVVCSKEIY